MFIFFHLISYVLAPHSFLTVNPSILKWSKAHTWTDRRTKQHCSVNLYADNTTIYICDHNPPVVGDKLDDDLMCIVDWINSNGLRMHECGRNTTNGLVQEKQTAVSITGYKAHVGERELLPKQESVKYL